MKLVNILRGKRLDNKQKKIDKLYAEEGASDKVMSLQAEVNAKRHKHDIPDKNQMIYENYVQ